MVDCKDMSISIVVPFRLGEELLVSCLRLGSTMSVILTKSGVKMEIIVVEEAGLLSLNVEETGEEKVISGEDTRVDKALVSSTVGGSVHEAVSELVLLIVDLSLCVQF